MKRMYKIIIITIVLIVLLTACTNEQEKINEVNETNENPITIYCCEDDVRFLNTAISITKEKVIDANIKIETFANRKEYEMRLNTELLAGQGPDVVFFTPYTFNSIYKLIDANILYNMDELVNDDTEFESNKYNTVIMDGGILNKKRYIIPLDYFVGAFITTEELMKKNNITIDKNTWTVKQFEDKLREYCNISSKENKFFLDQSIQFSDYVLSSGIKLVDYENNSLFFDSKEFINMLQVYKAVFNKSSAPNDLRGKYDYKYWEMMKDNKCIAAYSPGIYNPMSIWMENSLINEYNSQKSRVFAMPSYQGGGHTAQVFNMVAINSSSENKPLSYSFIKSMLTKEYQKQKSIAFTPVNNEVFKELVDEYTSDSASGRKIGGKITINCSVPISEEIILDLDNIVSNINQCIIPDKNIMNFLNEIADSFVQDKCTINQAVDQLNNKVMLYLNE